MTEKGENVFECPHCGYLFLFPPALDEYTCPVCAGRVERPIKGEYKALRVKKVKNV